MFSCNNKNNGDYFISFSHFICFLGQCLSFLAPILAIIFSTIALYVYAFQNIPKLAHANFVSGAFRAIPIECLWFSTQSWQTSTENYPIRHEFFAFWWNVKRKATIALI